MILKRKYYLRRLKTGVRNPTAVTLVNKRKRMSNTRAAFKGDISNFIIAKRNYRDAMRKRFMASPPLSAESQRIMALMVRRKRRPFKLFKLRR